MFLWALVIEEKKWEGIKKQEMGLGSHKYIGLAVVFFFLYGNGIYLVSYQYIGIQDEDRVRPCESKLYTP